jgi:hypothetical protein
MIKQQVIIKFWETEITVTMANLVADEEEWANEDTEDIIQKAKEEMAYALVSKVATYSVNNVWED